ncbi:hypothetical protein GQ44DRAFT_711937 [Phaeosphaeriaceae sp. PMI808]|nr:hypothetical protein GQ44DRAFT_711937 [Phaeosphaeriaceae sp. PMI808]
MLFSTVVLAVASLGAVSATPLGARDAVPEVIPGPGLPSLESLNLTSADLYAMALPEKSKDEMSVLFDARCGPSEATYAPVNDGIACYNYLRSLGTTRCGVRGPGIPVTEMCRSGRAHVIAQSLTQRDESSYCSDVAQGLLWVFDHCTRNNRGDVAGFNSPNGNGNFFAGVTNINW